MSQSHIESNRDIGNDELDSSGLFIGDHFDEYGGQLNH